MQLRFITSSIYLLLLIAINLQFVDSDATPNNGDTTSTLQQLASPNRTVSVSTFDELNKAVQAQQPGEQILIISDLSLPAAVSITGDVLLRGQLNDDKSIKSLTCSGDAPAFILTNGAHLTLGGLKIQGCSKGIAQLEPDTVLQAQHVVFSNNSLTSNTALFSISDKAAVVLDGCQVSNNSVPGDGVLVRLEGKEAAFNASSSTEAQATFTGNRGGVLIQAKAHEGLAKVGLSDCEISNNEVDVLVVGHKAEINLYGLQLLANSFNTAALQVVEAAVNITALLARGNEGSADFFSIDQGTLTVTNSTISSNNVQETLIAVTSGKVELDGMQLLHNTAHVLLSVENGELSMSGDVNILRSNWAATLLNSSHSSVYLHNTLLLSNLAMQDGWGVLVHATMSTISLSTIIAKANGASVGLMLDGCSTSLHNVTIEETKLHPAGGLEGRLRAEEHAAELKGLQQRLAQNGVTVVVYNAVKFDAKSCVLKKSQGLQVLMWQRTHGSLSWQDLGVLDVMEGGGVVGVLGSSQLSIQDSTWGQVQGAPALEVYGGMTTIVRSSFLRNSAREGAAIWCTSTAAEATPALVELTNCSFSYNGATSQGGALLTRGCRVEAEDVHFSDNWSPGGGAWACDSCSARLTGAVFHSNAAENGGSGLGGAMLLVGGVDVDIDSSYFSENNATEGGVMALTKQGTNSTGAVRVTDSKLYGNSAQDAGGALWLSPNGSSTLTLVSTVLLNNRAPVNPGIRTPNPANVKVCCQEANTCVDFAPPGCPSWSNQAGRLSKSGLSADNKKDLGVRALTDDGCEVGETQKTEDNACMVCGPGSYTVNPKSDCKDCPVNAVCTSGIFTPLEGWWTSSPLSESLHKCLLRQACEYKTKAASPGGRPLNRTTLLTQYIQSNSLQLIREAERNGTPAPNPTWMNLQCNAGYTGRLCSVCNLANGFGRWMNECRKCSPRWLYWILAFISIMFVGNLLWQEMYGHLHAVFTTRAAYYNAAPREHASSPLSVSIDVPVTKQGKNWVVTKIIKVVVSYVQVLSLLKYADLQLPKGSLGEFFHRSIWWVDFTAPYTWFAVDCHLPGLPTVSVTRALFPLILMVFFIIFFCIVWVLVCLKQRQSRHPNLGLRNYILPRWCLSTMHIMWFFYPAATASVLSIFSCVDVTSPVASAVYSLKIKPTTGLYWVQDLSLKCYEGPHRVVLIMAGVPGLIFITAGYPLLLITILVSHRSKLALKRTLIKYGFLYEEYHKNMYLWDLVVTMRKLILVSMFVLLRHYATATAQLAAAEAVVLAAVVAQVGIRPFRYQLFNVMEALTLLAGALTFNVLLFDTIGAGFNETSRRAWTIVAIVANGLILIYYLGMAQWVECMYRNGNDAAHDNYSDLSSDDGHGPPDSAFQRTVRKLLAVLNIKRTSHVRGNGHLPGQVIDYTSRSGGGWTLSSPRAPYSGHYAPGANHASAAFDSISLQSSSNLGYQHESGVLEVTEHDMYDEDEEVFDQSMLYAAPQAGQNSSPQ